MICSRERHSWVSERKEHHIWNFCSSCLTMEQTFVTSLNAGQRPGYQQRIQLPNVLSVANGHQSSVSLLTTLSIMVTTLTATVSTPSLLTTLSIMVTTLTATVSTPSSCVSSQGLKDNFCYPPWLNHDKPLPMYQYHLQTLTRDGKQSLKFI